MKNSELLAEKENHDCQIRKEAEAKIVNMTPSPEMAGRKTDELIHELQVHQIELEMQNEELKRAQIAEEEIKNRYIDLYDFAPVGYFTFSSEGQIKEVNLRGAQLLWIPRAKLINRGFGDFVEPSDFYLWNDHLHLSLLSKDGEKQSCDLRLKSDDGSTIFVRLESVRIGKMDGTSQVRSAVSDITQSKRVEEALQESENMLNDAQQLAQIGSWSWNVETDEVRWSKELYEMTGHNPLLPPPTFADHASLYSKDSWKLMNQAVKRAITKGMPYEMELEMVRPDGQKRYTNTKGKAIMDKAGRVVRLYGMVQDITQRKITEVERMQLIKREHEALAEAQAARELAHLKSMFIASTSHELRTPLNSIIGFTSLTLDGTFGELNPDQKKHLKLVLSSGKHLLSLINDILDLSLIDSGKIKVEVSEFNLRMIVDEAISTLKVILNERKLELKVDVSDINMKSDRRRLLQCLINLINNAIKFTEKGSVEITAKVIDKNVEISVIDMGIGIKTQDISKLFGPFVRLQSPVTLRTSGTGLGLYLVKIIAKDVLGGDVEVISEFGKGSKFTLRVPIELGWGN